MTNLAIATQADKTATMSSLDKIDEFDKYMSVAKHVLRILEAQDTLEAYKDCSHPHFEMFAPCWEGESSMGEICARLQKILENASKAAQELFEMTKTSH